MKYCKDCVGFDECKTTGRTVEFAVDDGVCIDFDERKPQTNADKIRSMAEEELAELMLDGCRGSNCDDQPQNEWGSVNCFQCRVAWLRQSAEGE